MIFNEHQAIHLHIGKTAGVAVEQLLRPGLRDAGQADFDSMFGYDHDRQVYLQHASAALVRDLAADRFDSFYTFSVVRNPYARLFSAYYYLGPLHDEMFGSFESFILGLRDYLAVPHHQRGSHFLPQVSYTHIGTEAICDDVVYFEDLPASLDPVRDRLHISAELAVHNRIRGPHRPTTPPAEHYTPAMVAIVQDLYAGDFEVLGYHPDPGSPAPLLARVPAEARRSRRTSQPSGHGLVSSSRSSGTESTM